MEALNSSKVYFTGLWGIENANVYKTVPIFSGLGHGKLAEFLILQWWLMINTWAREM